tara:strand:+ start:17857 stop:18594 length:738 start_codon:yes stop_codon:yes gene_type:complete
MRIRAIFFLLLILSFTSCDNEEGAQSAVLSQVLAFYSDFQLDEVIACAASKENDNSTSYIYYYPIPGATNIQYFETDSVDLISDNYNNYYEVKLPEENVFGGYLKRFVRSGDEEVYCIVTFQVDGKFHKSNPIRLKNRTKPTEYSSTVAIDQTQSLMPLFSWEDGQFLDTAIYFQVLSDANNDFISGTYTTEKSFQYYKLSNVVLDINRTVPQDLILNQQYNFSMLAVSLDNWVNLVIETPFIAQ